MYNTNVTHILDQTSSQMYSNSCTLFSQNPVSNLCVTGFIFQESECKLGLHLCFVGQLFGKLKTHRMFMGRSIVSNVTRASCDYLENVMSFRSQLPATVEDVLEVKVIMSLSEIFFIYIASFHSDVPGRMRLPL